MTLNSELLSKVPVQSLSFLLINSKWSSVWISMPLTQNGLSTVSMLCDLNQITALDISCNKIGADGINCLAEALQKNTSIRTLNLKGNAIGSSGCSAVKSIIVQNKKTEEFGYEHQ